MESKPIINPVNKKRRNANWTDSEIYKLIDIWGENVQDLRKLKHNKMVYTRICAMLEEYGESPRTWDEIKMKIKNMSRKYREERAKLENSGGNSSQWKFYVAVNDIIGMFPSETNSMLESIATSNIHHHLHEGENDPEPIMETIWTGNCEANPIDQEVLPCMANLKKAECQQEELHLVKLKEARYLAQKARLEALLAKENLKCHRMESSIKRRMGLQQVEHQKRMFEMAERHQEMLHQLKLACQHSSSTS